MKMRAPGALLVALAVLAACAGRAIGDDPLVIDFSKPAELHCKEELSLNERQFKHIPLVAVRGLDRLVNERAQVYVHVVRVGGAWPEEATVELHPRLAEVAFGVGKGGLALVRGDVVPLSAWDGAAFHHWSSYMEIEPGDYKVIVAYSLYDSVPADDYIGCVWRSSTLEVTEQQLITTVR